MFFKLLHYDIKKGCFSEYRRLIVVICLTIAICIAFSKEFLLYNSSLSESTYGDLLFYMFAGIHKFVPGTEKRFLFPAIWALLMFLPLFFVLYYPFYDLLGYGKNTLILSQNRKMWWLSKCCWCFIYIAIFFLVVYLTTAIYCLTQGIPLSFKISVNSYNMVVLKDYIESENYTLSSFSGSFSPSFYLLPIFVISSYSFVQMTISLLLAPAYSYMISVSFFVLSAFYMKPFLLGNYTLALRNKCIIQQGMQMRTGMVLSILTSVTFIIVGAYLFDRHDILNRSFRSE